MIFLIYIGGGLIVMALSAVFMTRDLTGGPTGLDFVDYMTIATASIFAGAAWPAMVPIGVLALILFWASLRREKRKAL